MRKIACCLALLLAPLAFGQQSSSQNPVTDAVRNLMERQSKNMIAAAEEMPADKYSYKPTDQQMTFAKLMEHTIHGNEMYCSGLAGTAAPEDKVSDKDGKDKLVAALKQSFDYCNTALGKVQDAQLKDQVELSGGRKLSKAMAALGLTSGWADHYGAAAMYLRLNGMLPPTAQKPTTAKAD